MNRIEETEDLETLSSFFREVFPEDEINTTVEVLRWRYRKSAPDAWRGRNLVWCSEGRIAGHFGILPVLLNVNGAVVRTAWFIDWVVFPEFRGRAGGIRLLQEALERFPIGLCAGLTERSEGIIRRMGWKDLGKTDRFVLPLGVSALPGLRGFERLVGETVRRAMGFFRTERQDVGETSEAFLPPSHAVREVGGGSIRVVRNTEYLRARYSDPAPWPRFFLEVSGRDKSGADFRTWSVWSVKPERGGGGRGRILEYLANTGSREAVEKTIRAGLRECRARGANLLEFNGRRVFPPEWRFRFPFIRREGLRMMWYATKKAEVPEGIGNAEDWYVTAGDADQER